MGTPSSQDDGFAGLALVSSKHAEAGNTLDVAADDNRLAAFIAPLRDAGCRVSMFIAADARQVEAAARMLRIVRFDISSISRRPTAITRPAARRTCCHQSGRARS